jgi:hypothetical protein
LVSFPFVYCRRGVGIIECDAAAVVASPFLAKNATNGGTQV